MPKIDFSNAERALLVANTALFLLRKIQGDEALIGSIIESKSKKAIAALLRRALDSQSKSLTAAVRPYVYAVALARAGGISELRSINKGKAERFKWLPIVIDYLSNSYQGTSEQTLSLRLGKIAVANIRQNSNSNHSSRMT